MRPDLEQGLSRLESDRDELKRLRDELQQDQRIHAELQRKLAEIDDAILFISRKIQDLENRLAKLKE